MLPVTLQVFAVFAPVNVSLAATNDVVDVSECTANTGCHICLEVHADCGVVCCIIQGVSAARDTVNVTTDAALLKTNESEPLPPVKFSNEVKLVIAPTLPALVPVILKVLPAFVPIIVSDEGYRLRY